MTPKDLRASFCSLAGRRHVDPVEAAQLTGHSFAVWAKHYARSFGKEQRDEARDAARARIRRRRRHAPLGSTVASRMNPEDVDLKALEQYVLHEVDSYRYEVPEGATLGRPWPPEKVEPLLDEMRAALVKPEWRIATIRDTVEQVDRDPPERRRCALVANDGDTYELYYDPQEEQFVLAMGAPPETTGVRGDAVGCWGAR